jgi:predicted Rossmann fold flavoprotein
MNQNLRVILLEKTSKLLSKVRISGGGRCNVTHALFDIGEMSRRYPRGQNFVKKSFHQFFTSDTISWFEERGVRLKTENDGRMFPDTDNSQTIIDALVREANRYGVDIRMNANVQTISQTERGFKLAYDGKAIDCEYVCIASGGYPKSIQFNWLKELGHSIADPIPSLFTFNLPAHPITALMGVTVSNVRVKIEDSKLVEEGPLLITHWGLSGPAILRLSAWGARELAGKNYSFRVHINWLPDQNEQELKQHFRDLRTQQPTKKLTGIHMGQLPQRLWLFLLNLAGAQTETRFADLTVKVENALIRNLIDFTVDVKGKTTFKEEFVTAGGIQLGEIDPQTMMSRKLPGVFFAGEVMDVDGITGGFNFQHAWTSGWIAAKSICTLASKE